MISKGIQCYTLLLYGYLGGFTPREAKPADAQLLTIEHVGALMGSMSKMGKHAESRC